MQRNRLGELADILIPGGQGMPKASDVDVAGTGVDRVLSIEPRHTSPLVDFLDSAGGIKTISALDQLSRQNVDGFRALTIVVANAYFMSPTVRVAIGYPGQEARDSSIGLGEDVMKMLGAYP